MPTDVEWKVSHYYSFLEFYSNSHIGGGGGEESSCNLFFPQLSLFQKHTVTAALVKYSYNEVSSIVLNGSPLSKAWIGLHCTSTYKQRDKLKHDKHNINQKASHKFMQLFYQRAWYFP